MFQSTHPYRVRHCNEQMPVLAQLFQSTHPYRVRRNVRWFSSFFAFSFNPRTHTGCDSKMFFDVVLDFTFQSTHPYRVRHHLF